MTKKGLYQPPKLALRFFRWYCRTDRREELEGDLEEFFYIRKNEGQPLWKAQLFFWWNVLRCYRSYSKSKTQKTMTFYPLFKSYFKLALRHSWKNKWSVLINIIGLGVALSMCIFVYSIYAHNIEFDSFYDNTEDVYRINSMTFENGRERRNEISPIAMDEVLRNDISGVQQISSFFDDYFNVKYKNEFFEESVGVASNDFIEMFPIPLWYGSYEGFGDQPLVYLSKPTAKKYFGDEVALGEKLTFYLNTSQKIELEVAGVFDRIPLNSSFSMNMFISLNSYAKKNEFNPNDWENKFYVSHYIRATDESTSMISDQMSQYVSLQNEGHKELKINRFELVPFRSDIHNANEMYRNNTNTRLNADIYIIFTSLAGMVFLIACFNLANSSMAMIAKRLKEIGIRKTLGSENRQILIQFLIEMGIVCLLAFIVGLSMIDFTSSSIMGLFGETFLIRDISAGGVMVFIIVFLMFTTFVAGIMPALYAWKFQPAAIIRKSVKLRGIGIINKVLTVAQYAFSITVLSAAISFTSNQEFLDTLDVGYANNDIYALELQDKSKYPILKQKLDQIAGVRTVGAQNHIQRFGRSSYRKLLEIDTSSYELQTYTFGDRYLDIMEVPIVLGRDFISGSQSDQERTVIVNQEFANQYFGGKSPIDAVVKIDGESRTIIGVYANLIQDVYADSEDKPAAFMYNESDEYRYLIAKVDGLNKIEFESRAKTIWSEEVDSPYTGYWQKDLTYGSAVRDTENLRIIFLAMAILGGILSVAGIFSLSKLNVAKRIKEISIRKVLGSSFSQLLITVNRTFTIVLAISVAIGCALGYFISDFILGMVYDYYVDVSPLTSLGSGLFIMSIAVVIITLSVMATIKTNPVVGLREE